MAKFGFSILVMLGVFSIQSQFCQGAVLLARQVGRSVQTRKAADGVAQRGPFQKGTDSSCTLCKRVAEFVFRLGSSFSFDTQMLAVAVGICTVIPFKTLQEYEECLAVDAAGTLATILAAVGLKDEFKGDSTALCRAVNLCPKLIDQKSAKILYH